MKALTTICALIAVPLVAFAGDDAAKKAPAAGAPAPPPAVKPAEPPKMPAPTPAKELDTLKPYAKSWACAGATPTGEKVNAKFALKLDIDKFWYAASMDVPKTKAMGAFMGRGYIGIDAAAKAWVFDGYDNHGGMIHLKAATGAVTADAVTFEGDAVDAPGKAPAKFTMKIDGKTKHMAFVGEIGGKKVFDYDCK